MYSTKTLGQKVKFFRIRRRLSQFELELQIEAAPGSISRIENGCVNPTKETLLIIAKVLNLNFQETASLFEIDFEQDEYVNLIARKVLQMMQSQRMF